MFPMPEFQPSREINLFQNFKRCSHDWSKLLQIVRCTKIYGWNSNRTLHSPFQQAAMKRRTWLDGGSFLTKTLLWLNRSERISKNNNFYLKFTCKFIQHADFAVDPSYWRLENIPFRLPNISVVPSKFHVFPPRVWESLRRRKHEILRITKFYSTRTRRAKPLGICSFDFNLNRRDTARRIEGSLRKMDDQKAPSNSSLSTNSINSKWLPINENQILHIKGFSQIPEQSSRIRSHPPVQSSTASTDTSICTIFSLRHICSKRRRRTWNEAQRRN